MTLDLNSIVGTKYVYDLCRSNFLRHRLQRKTEFHYVIGYLYQHGNDKKLKDSEGRINMKDEIDFIHLRY